MKEEGSKGEGSKVFDRVAQGLFDKLSLVLPGFFGNQQVKRDLEHLHPGGDKEAARREFYVGKLKLSLLIITVGVGLAVLVSVRAGIDRRPDGKNAFKRGELSEEVREIAVETVIEGDRERFLVPVWARQPTEEEIEELYREFRAGLPGMIVGENASLQDITGDLELLESFDGFPFQVEWKSDDPERISSAGAVELSEEPGSVTLTALVSYGDRDWEEQLAVTVAAPEYTDEERKHRELEKLLLTSECESRGEEYWTLPEEWEGRPVAWSRTVENYGFLIGGVALFAGIAVYFLKDKDLHDEVQKRRACMKREYPDIVHKLVLYLGAGMTLRGAFQKIADEYTLRRAQGHAESPAYEEILFTCRELKSGVSEGEVYEHFGRRTGLQEYIRLCTLLSQNLKKGNNTLLSRLHEEADRVCAERIQDGRRLGEEASTKLLVPMVMMLAVVMVMIMLPAFYSMGL